MVFLVGAGPGDPQLITLRGAEVLRRADVVVYDSLANPALLRLAPPAAEVVSRSPEGLRQGQITALKQEDIIKILIARAREGKTVVRLKGGDPYVFGRGGEEVEALASSGIEFEVVPGVSSISAVPNYAGIPLTHRLHSSMFTVFTGHEDPNKPGSAIPWEQVASVPGTKVILMGAERVSEITGKLLAGGASAKTPAAMVEWGTLGRQRSVVASLGDLAGKAQEAGLGAPSVVVIGDVVSLHKKLGWFANRPLHGQTVVVTRAKEQAEGLTRALEESGAEVLRLPCIRIETPTDRESLVDAIAGLNQYDWLVFTSANGVTSFFEHFFKGFEDLRDLGGGRIAAVGPATAARLRELHLRVDLLPAEQTAKGLAKALAAQETIENLKVLLLRAEKANPDLPKLLSEEGAIVDDVAVYRTVFEESDPEGTAGRLQSDGVDWITFTSGSTVESLHARLDLVALSKKFPKMRFASIGPETSRAIESLGLKVAVEAKPHTEEGLVEALLKGPKRRK